MEKKREARGGGMVRVDRFANNEWELYGWYQAKERAIAAAIVLARIDNIPVRVIEEGELIFDIIGGGNDKKQ